MIMAEQDFVLLDHPIQDTGGAVKPQAASAVRSRLDRPDRILYQKNLQEQRHKICVRKLDGVPIQFATNEKTDNRTEKTEYNAKKKIQTKGLGEN